MPLYGALQPSETQPVSFTFYGHADMVARVKALCEVEGGPTYGILLSGEASLVSYAFNKTEIDYGLQPFDQICMAEITLRNTGKVRFEYSVLNSVLLAAENPPPGVPLTRPAASHIESGKEQVLKVYYLPGIPEVFQRTFQIQVAHLEPDSITLKGEGIFPRICLDLPRNLKGNERYSTLLREVKERMEQESQKDSTSNSEAVATEPFVDESVTAFDTQLLMELERLLVQEHALEQQKLLGFESTEDSGASQRALRKLLGFNTELDRVKNLPFCQTQTFEVWFDPQSANQPLGEVDVLLPIKVVAGPTFHISLRATVIMPSLCISNNDLEFSAVQCGQCQKFYRNYLILSISQSTQQLLLNVSGQGLEPRLEFSPAILELGPLLPYAIGDEAEVVVKNPCCFPIEFYSLEFDQQYLLEERILRMLKGYDSHNILLLPPRVPGEKLPPEVLEYYEEQKKSQGDQETLNQETAEEEETMHVSEPGIKPHLSSTVQTTSTTVSILPSLSLHDDNRGSRVESKFEEEEEEEEEGTDKGQPQTGSQQSLTKHQEATSAAVALAKHYSAACLSIDLVVLEAISDGSSSAGLRARELCIRAAIEQAQRETEEGGAEGQPALALGARLSAEALGKHASDGSQQSSESKTGPLSAVSRGYRGSSVTAKGKSEGHASQKQQLHQQPDPAGSQPHSQRANPAAPQPQCQCGRRLWPDELRASRRALAE
ncbi:Hydrocephalus-inducing protein [Varanus komodoensis]|nr:Hydrocephalus-inducing protein [Varanus komodoensis]